MSRLISDNSYVSTDALRGVHIEHHGILGQKWGIRRFRNKDGTLTDAGKKRYGENKETSENIDRTEKFYSDVDNAFDESIKNVDPLKRSFKKWQKAVDDYGYYKTTVNPEFKDAYKKALKDDSFNYENAQRKVLDYLKSVGNETVKNVNLDNGNWSFSKEGELFMYAFGDSYERKVIIPALEEYRSKS